MAAESMLQKQILQSLCSTPRDRLLTLPREPRFLPNFSQKIISVSIYCLELMVACGLIEEIHGGVFFMGIGSVIRAGFQFPKGWGIWTSASLGVVALGAIGGAAAYFIHKRSKPRALEIKRVVEDSIEEVLGDPSNRARRSSSSPEESHNSGTKFDLQRIIEEMELEEFECACIRPYVKGYMENGDISQLVESLVSKRQEFKGPCGFDALIEVVKAEKERREA